MARSDQVRAKAFERWCARLFGGRRRGNTGVGGCDVIEAPVALECKATAQLMIRTDWYEQAVRQGRDEGKPWVLAMRPKGWRDPVGLVDLKYLAHLVRCEQIVYPAQLRQS